MGQQKVAVLLIIIGLELEIGIGRTALQTKRLPLGALVGQYAGNEKFAELQLGLYTEYVLSTGNEGPF